MNTPPQNFKKSKEQPGLLRKENKRLLKSRDNIKAKNREKSRVIRRTKDLVTEARQSRDSWQRKTLQSKKEVKNLTEKIESYIDREMKHHSEIQILRGELKKKRG